MTNSEIGTVVALFIALYGAVLSTINFRRDRAKVKLTVRRNMRQMFGHHGITLVELQVINVGRRPVTVRSFGATGLYPHDCFVANETNPPLPCEITEGQCITSLVPQADIDFSTIDYWEVWDSQRRIYKLQEASWFKHWKSMRQLRRSFKEKQRSR